MALILLIETSTTSCSVALAEDSTVIAVKQMNERNVHASHITIFIEDVLRSAGKTTKDLSAVAVSMGPGSYTGLRIGVSAAKGMCYALDVPLIAVSTLQAMTAGMLSKIEVSDALLCPMIDARRMEVYTAVFDNQLQEISPIEAKIIDAESFADILAARKVLFFGDGAEKCIEALGGNVNVIFSSDFVNSASDMSVLASEKFTKGEFENLAYFEPYYLKDFLVAKPKSSTISS
jgi:tRNA threonylcarbamoyladenosine biosynthesis protein TsaB